jgi:hypothetical protein
MFIKYCVIFLDNPLDQSEIIILSTGYQVLEREPSLIIDAL